MVQHAKIHWALENCAMIELFIICNKIIKTLSDAGKVHFLTDQKKAGTISLYQVLLVKLCLPCVLMEGLVALCLAECFSSFRLSLECHLLKKSSPEHPIAGGSHILVWSITASHLLSSRCSSQSIITYLFIHLLTDSPPRVQTPLRAGIVFILCIYTKCRIESSRE